MFKRRDENNFSQKDVVWFVYSLYDKVANSYSLPFFQRSDVCAVREFAVAMANCSYRDDIQLIHLGSYSLSTGEFTSVKRVIEIDLDAYYLEHQKKVAVVQDDGSTKEEDVNG